MKESSMLMELRLLFLFWTDDYINDVFVQVPLRGKVADNIEYRRALLGTRQNTQKEYIMREPDFNSTQTLNLLTYTNI